MYLSPTAAEYNAIILKYGCYTLKVEEKEKCGEGG
jgi:hypothetical protein